MSLAQFVHSKHACHRHLTGLVQGSLVFWHVSSELTWVEFFSKIVHPASSIASSETEDCSIESLLVHSLACSS